MNEAKGQYEVYEKELTCEQKYLQTLYNDNFSFLGFDEFCRNVQRPLAFTIFCSLSTYAAFDLEEIRMCRKTQRKFLPIMQARLLDALYSMRDKINENIKQLKEIDNDRN